MCSIFLYKQDREGYRIFKTHEWNTGQWLQVKLDLIMIGSFLQVRKSPHVFSDSVERRQTFSEPSNS